MVTASGLLAALAEATDAAEASAPLPPNECVRAGTGGRAMLPEPPMTLGE